jgi:hypothetical protein
MDVVLRYRGREVSRQDVEFIRALIEGHPDATRRALSIQLCEAWDWVQPNGALRDGVCRALLLALHRGGHIELPTPQWRSSKKPWKRLVPAPIEVDTTPLETRLRDLGPVQLRQVRRTPEEELVNGLVAQHHYLGYSQPVGEHLKYLVTAQGRPIACFCWSSAPRHLAPRDQYIGWLTATRKVNIRLVAYQTRFLILPWVRVPHLASHLLGRMSRQLSDDWEQLYAHPIYFTETFVDPERNRGTCYRAANWTALGLTKGRGKDAPTHASNRSLKLLFGYPLVHDFRERLCAMAPSGAIMSATAQSPALDVDIRQI